MMKHCGDITKLSGYDLPIVDVITGGSPCQDLSVAGKRAGLAGERSGLFMEQMRIVKEMREKDARDNGRTDYAVLEEIVRIVCKEAPPVPIPKDGWPKAGCISGVGDSGCPFSIAWRLHDAQFWGVPQRRKRIALVADFGGLAAPEVLFERTGLRRDLAKSGEERQGTAKGTERSVGEAKPIAFQGSAGAAASLQVGEDVSCTLGVTKEACAVTSQGTA